ncbi:unnamed protein product [Durusdinium trenchii]|uniref:Protein transport protein SEC13 n=1 Tax=Durusdinium trenchii TaxID=1381693 RepID=A0ABP0S0G3_9DINO
MTAIVSQFDTAHTAPILDTQLDELCLRLATASADGLVKLWDVQSPEDPIFLCDLDGHTGPVRQASWAPVGTGAGALLLTGGDDGRVLLWGPCHDAKRWQLVHEEDLSRHGEVKAVSWAPVNVGAAFACALSDGTVTATIHQGTVRSGEADVEHRWQTQSFAIHQGEVHAVSWASSVGPELGKLAGACLASAGDDGLRVWSILDAAAPNDETPHTARRDPSSTWVVEDRVNLEEEVWKIEWYQAGSQLLVTCGTKEYRSILLKQQLSGKWDVIDLSGDVTSQ